MKVPKSYSAKKPLVKKSTSKKSEGGKDGAGFSVNQVLQLATASAHVTTSVIDYKKEVEVTKRTQMDAQKAITLGEQELVKAHMQHYEKMEDLRNTREDNIERHRQAMDRLVLDGREMGMKESKQNRVLDQLEAKEITAEEAALLLYGSQE